MATVDVQVNSYVKWTFNYTIDNNSNAYSTFTINYVTYTNTRSSGSKYDYTVTLSVSGSFINGASKTYVTSIGVGNKTKTVYWTPQHVSSRDKAKTAASCTVTFGVLMARLDGNSTNYNGSASITWTVPVKPSYAITYNANGGSAIPAPNPDTKWFGESLTLKSGNTLSNYTFVYWNTNSSGTGSIYYAGSAYTYNSAETLYATWQRTVSYDANGGSNAPGSQNALKSAALTITSSKPSRSGYSFLGWGAASNSTSASYQPGGSYPADYPTTKLYAVWGAMITSFQVDRCEENGALSDEGQFMKITMSWNKSPNATSVAPTLTLSSSPSVSMTNPTLSGTSGVDQEFVVSGPFDPDTRYEITATLTDSVNTGGYQVEDTLDEAFFTMDVLGDAYLYNLSQHRGLETANGTTYYTRSGTGVGSDPYVYAEVSKTWLEWNNLLEPLPDSENSTEYLALSIRLNKGVRLVSGTSYTLVLNGVSVRHTGKSVADAGLSVYYCGGSVRLGGWYGTSNFTVVQNGNFLRAVKLIMKFTPQTSSAATTATYSSQNSGGITVNTVSSHTSAGSAESLSHSSVTGATDAYINIYNSVPSASGTMSLTVASWSLSTGSTESSYASISPKANGWYEANGPRPGHGVAFGGPAKTEGFYVNMPIRVETRENHGYGVMTRNYVTGTDTAVSANSSWPTTPVQVDLMVGSGGVNHGLWSVLLNKWMIYGDAANVYVNGINMTIANIAEQVSYAMCNRGTNVTNTSTDTMSFWKQKPPGFYWYNAGNAVNGQPSQYGYLLHLHRSSGDVEVYQLWFVQPGGAIYRRGGNGNTTSMPSWTAV